MGKTSLWYDDLITGKPPKGCELCAIGAKVVIFITGECLSSCYYCPISKERRRDIQFVDEQPFSTIEELVKEANMIDALGAGITGGEPLLKLKQVTTIISELKSIFSENFHIHLYTGKALTYQELKTLHSSGLDEIRFHPTTLNLLNEMKNSITQASKLDWDVGIEIPVIPNQDRKLNDIIIFAEETGLKFVNLNEFEFTETNFSVLQKMGFNPKNEFSSAVEGSRECAHKIIKQNKEKNITLHFCSSSFKDKIQLKNRFIRRAQNFARGYDEITEEGLIVRGRIRVKEKENTHEILEFMKKELELPKTIVEIAANGTTILTHWTIVEDIGEELNEIFEEMLLGIEIIHQYPYEEGFITYINPIIEL